ncbi:MAG: hypothetical protein GTO24_16920 [candidate division Zixibacteria bacterium]|nr:hypothetical protein [candidate division Zixibacteria bacterium]
MTHQEVGNIDNEVIRFRSIQRLFMIRRGFNVRKEYKPDEAGQRNGKSIDMEEQTPRLAQGKNPKDNNPH